MSGATGVHKEGCTVLIMFVRKVLHLLCCVISGQEQQA